MNFKHKVFYKISSIAVKKSVKEDSEMAAMWELSHEVLPDLEDHYATVELSGEALLRVRMLICAQALFIEKIINQFTDSGKQIENYVDIGDSDGSTRMLIERKINNQKIKTLGVNLQAKAVELIKSKGMDAVCMNAMELDRQFDLVSVFETLEHLPDPIGFLQNMQKVVGKRLIISVPLMLKSRVGLRYVTDKWPAGVIPTIANNHIFELSPQDWNKLFKHTGWGIEHAWEVRQFPKKGLLKILMQYAWRKISFEGFYFVSLIKDDKYTSQYTVE